MDGFGLRGTVRAMVNVRAVVGDDFVRVLGQSLRVERAAGTEAH